MSQEADGKAIQRLRKKLKLTQEKLAEGVELDVRTIRRAEKGSRVAEGTLARIAQCLGVEATALVHVVPKIDALQHPLHSTGGSASGDGRPRTTGEMIMGQVDIRRVFGLDHLEEMYRLCVEPVHRLQE